MAAMLVMEHSPSSFSDGGGGDGDSPGGDGVGEVKDTGRCKGEEGGSLVGEGESLVDSALRATTAKKATRKGVVG